MSGDVALAATFACALPSAVDFDLGLAFTGATRFGFFGGLLTTAVFGVRAAGRAGAGCGVGGGGCWTKD